MNMKSRWQDFKTSMQPRVKEWRFMLKRIRESPLAVAGVVLVLFFVAIALLAPVLAPPNGDPYAIPQDMEVNALLSGAPTPPTTRHVFGTTVAGYDIYYACIWGTITAFRVGVLVVAISLVIGLSIGTLAGYYGGFLDEALMRFTDVIIAFPGLILAMAFVIVFPAAIPISISPLLVVFSLLASFLFLFIHPDRRLLLLTQFILLLSLLSYAYYPLNFSLPLSGLDKVLVALTIVGWPSYTRLIRGEVLRVKNEDYVEASRASGSSDFRTITRHILPNSIYPILIMATLDIGSIVLTAAALSFLGIGAPSNYADWGQIIQKSQDYISNPTLLVANYYTFLIPGLFITFFVMGWNLLGDALRDVLDPMLRRR